MIRPEALNLFRRFFDNTKRGLAEILSAFSLEGISLANMGVKCCFGVFLFCFSRSPKTRNQPEPATCSTTPSGERFSFGPKKFAFCHVPSLRCPRQFNPCGNQTEAVPSTRCFLHISKQSSLSYWRLFREGGTKLLFARKSPNTKKSDKDCIKRAVFTLLHSPPAAHGINRTTWRMVDLQKILRERHQPLCGDVIRRIIKEAGYKWRRARVVLTSKDPDYRTKVEAIKRILSELRQDEAFFSIDEYGPFAVKQKGGIKRVAPGQQYVVPQWQKSKGWMILTAALELSRNQVTHFYSRQKNTGEMIKMADLLRAQYRTFSTIYLSWDAASWHMSKKLVAHLKKINDQATADGFPIVKTAPLPAGAQFLNVIESVFSGMARGIIHNSDYPSVEAARDAIDRYFSQRNEHFSRHPKRAGQKIWGKERVPSEFAEGQNCKDPLYQYR